MGSRAKVRKMTDPKFARDAWLRALAKTAAIGDQGITLPVLLDRLAGEYDLAPALSSSESSMNFRQLRARCNQYAHWGIDSGWIRGDVVALLMTNCAEYVAIWLGLTRIGIEVALINSQLSGEVLAHSIAVVNPKAVIVGADLATRFTAIRGRLPRQVVCSVAPDAAVAVQSGESPLL